MSSRRAADGPPAGQPPAKKPALDIASIRAQIAAKKAAVEARLAGTGSGSASPSPGPGTPSAAPGPAALPPKPTVDPEIAARIAAAKARIDALKNKQANPYLSGGGGAVGSGSGSGSRSGSGAAKARPQGVSNVALHPLLMGDAGAGSSGSGGKNEKMALRDRYKTMAPKFSTVRANAAVVEAAEKAAEKSAPRAVTNPYAAGASLPQDELAGANIASRKSRKMQFSAPGKYVRQGDQLRNEIKLEELKQRIAAQSRKAGLDSEFDVLERSLKRQPPPQVEWWDEAIMPSGSTYDDIQKAQEWYTTSGETRITHLIQHPIPITAPSDRKLAERGLMLTKKEAKKMRRQRRLAELEDKRDRQKMGLIPPDPPKVRLANLMKVLTSDAVQDPTKVEHKVRREVALRKLRHEKDNENRKLTPEQRAEKEYAKMAERERNGLLASVYIIKHLTNGRHKFKVKKTAEDDMLTGMCLFYQDFAIVVVEGVAKKIRHYRQLMMHRIDWTEEARARAGSDDDDSDADAGSDAEQRPKRTAAIDVDEDGPDMSENKCEIIWEGEIPERTFRIFRARHPDTDSAGKDYLTPKYEGMWDLAKRWTWQGEDL